MTIVTPQAVTRDAAMALTPTRVRWTWIAPTLLVVWIVSMFDKSNISIVINNPEFLGEMGLAGNPAKLGWLASSLFIAYGVTAPLWGWSVMRLGPRVTAAISLIIWALACVWSGLATSYEMLLGSRILLGFGEAALFPLTLALVANWFALKERGKATSFWWIGTMIGPMLTGLLVTGLIVAFGWRMQFHAMALIAVLFPLPMVWFLLRDTPERHPAVNQAETDWIKAGALERNQDAPGKIFAGSVDFWTNYRFWLVVVAITANNVFYWGWSIWLPTYLRTARGFSFSISGYLTFAIFGCAVLTILAIGYYSDRIFRRAPLAGLGWGLSAVLLMSAAFAPSPTLSVVLMIAALCSQQVGVACGEMLMHSVAGTADMGKSQGIRAFVTQTIGAFSPAMIGYFLAGSGGFIGAFSVLAIAVVIAAGCMAVLAYEGL